MTKKSTTACAFAGGALVLCGAEVGGADWSFDPRVSATADYNDNVRLTEVSGQEIEVTGAELDAQITLRRATPTWSLALTPRLRSTFYPGDPDEESDDQFVRLDFRNTTERTRSTLGVDYWRATTLGRYFPPARVVDADELGEPEPGVGVGRSDVRNREERIGVSPAMRITLGERSFLDVGVKYLDVAYDRQVEDDREDFAAIRGIVAYRYRTSDTASLALRGGYGRQQPEQGDDREAYGVDVEWANHLSETAQVFLRGGVNRARVDSRDGGSAAEWEEGFGGGAGVRWRFEITTLFIDVNRYLDPSSSGTIVTRDQLRAEWARRLGPMTTLTLGARLITDSGAIEEGFVDREYAAGTIKFDWRISRQWALVASYEYRWRDYDGSISDAESNGLNLGVVYEPNRGEP